MEKVTPSVKDEIFERVVGYPCKHIARDSRNRM